jgi:hypothetical protein
MSSSSSITNKRFFMIRIAKVQHQNIPIDNNSSHL